MNKELKNIKTTGFKTPDNYFDTIEDNVMDNIKLNNILNSKSTGQTTPEGYFDTIEDSVFQKINSSKKEIKVIRLFTRKNMFYAASIAAAIILMLIVVLPSNPSFSNLELETVENYIYQESYSSEDIAALLTEEELKEVLYADSSYSDESLEDYILDNTTIEDFIIE
jgi:hypothetical protein